MGTPRDQKRDDGNGYIYTPTKTSDNEKGNNVDDDMVQASCGIGRFKPDAMKVCANMCVFTGIYSFAGLLTSTLTSYVNSQVTTLERHFGFNSSQTGLIMAANDIGFLVVVLFLSHIAGKVHIPRALGWGTIGFGISGVMCALPYFLYGAPSPSEVINNVTSLTSSRPTKSFSGQICDGVNETEVNCDVTTTDNSKMADSVDPGNNARAHAGAALVVIVLGMLLQGVAKTPRAPFTTTYVDANVDRTKTGFYMGIIITLGITGPAVAYALGGVFTRIYVTLEDTNMHFRHPKWIGAWWLGYVTFGVASCVFAIPLFCFPRQMKKPKHKLQKEVRSGRQISVQKRIIGTVKGFITSLLRLCINPVYVCIVASACCVLFAIAGANAFTPKYIENQFSFPAWKANMAMAGMMLCTASVGTFVGGYLTKKCKMGPMASMKFTLTMQFISAICTGLTIFFKCDQPYLYNSPGPRTTSFTSLSGCHDDCACDDDDYFPVCGDDGRTFFSPCHAGCLKSVGQTRYSNCSCVEGGMATAGMCDFSCSMFIPFMVFMCGSSLFNTFTIVPRLIIYIRVVEDRDKPLGLGFSGFMTSVTGWMLGPILFGKLIDNICIQWDNDACTGSGSCRLYDNDNFRLKLFGFQVMFKAIGVILVIIALIFAKVSKIFEVKGEMKDGIKGKEMEPVNGISSNDSDKEKIIIEN